MEFRKQLNDFLGQAHYQFQGASRQDMDQIMAALTHIEQRTADSEERLAKRCEELGAQLERLEGKLAGGKQTSRKTPRKTAARKSTRKKASASRGAAKKTGVRK